VVPESALSKGTETFAVNDRVNHSGYGLGKITEVNPRHTTISFDLAGIRKFVTSMVRLERSDAPAPPKASRAKAAKTASATKATKATKPKATKKS
jgi:hypothetical protein